MIDRIGALPVRIPFQLHRRIPFIRRPFYQRDAAIDERRQAILERDRARAEIDVIRSEYSLQRSYSQEAEDIIVEMIMAIMGRPPDRPGFYVDAGAHDPLFGSTTHRLYQRGWHGLNIEPNPDAMPRFAEFRQRDVTVNVGVGPDGESGTYVSFDIPLLNGFLSDRIVQAHLDRGRIVVSRRQVPFRSLNGLLEEYAPPEIDYLNVDVERMEYAVLSELDLDRWRPLVIAVEILGPSDISSVVQDPVAQLLVQRGYTHISRLIYTNIFGLANRLPKTIAVI